MTDNILEKIKQLRHKTGISIIECKKALLNNQMDIEKSILYLREKGILNARIKSQKNTKEGLINLEISSDRKNAIIYELNCETDFVAKSTELKDFSKKINNYFLTNLKTNKKLKLYNNELLNDDLETMRIDLISKIGENIIVRKLTELSTIDNNIIGYTHTINNNTKIGSLVLIDNFLEEYKQLYTDIAMQITAMSPKYIARENIPQHTLDQEKNINKSISSFLKENVLLEQPFIKNDKITINSLIDNRFKIISFTRLEVGEELN